MARGDHDTPERILGAARRLLRRGGPAALTFDAVAREIGMTKQAVLYWFPGKAQLVAALVLPALEAEANAVREAVRGATGPAEAAEAAIRAIAAFHLADLDRFRMMYLAPQLAASRGLSVKDSRIEQRIHATTAPLYDALGAALAGSPPQDIHRQRAMALHAAVLGVVTMVALGEAVDDPLKHSPEALVHALVSQFARPPT